MPKLRIAYSAWILAKCGLSGSRCRRGGKGGPEAFLVGPVTRRFLLRLNLELLWQKSPIWRGVK